MRRQIETAAKELRKARREEQQRINRAIGEGRDVEAPPLADRITLAEAEASLVFVTDGRQVADENHRVMPYHEFEAAYAASMHRYVDGRSVPRTKPVSRAWLESHDRKTIEALTFAPGRGPVTRGPQGVPALNSWRPRVRTAPDGWETLVEPFVAHVRWLWGAYAEQFLDWLAHIEQKPGELPHYGWLHIARSHGMGRNWLAGVLTRVWRGDVAASFDLVGTLDTGFNARLSRCMLAIVDEVCETGGLQWSHANALRQLVTAEVRAINPKYGRQTLEYNAARFLLFSNHANALPLDENDRRFFVVDAPGAPLGTEYYRTLYLQLDNPEFIAAVGWLLSQRDISGFQPGARPPMTDAKKALTTAAKSETDLLAEDVVRGWPVDVITLSEIADQLGHEPTKATSHALDRAGLRRCNQRQIRMPSGRERPYAIRDHDRWVNASPDALRAEIGRLTTAAKRAALEL
ncbi:MAG: DUF5906 domain-containing protein [Hyphomonadaceae bacterium]